MIFSIANEYVAVRRHRYPFQPFELPVPRAPQPERPQEGPVGVEDLDPIVSRVRHANVPLVVHGHTSETKKGGILEAERCSILPEPRSTLEI